MLSMNSDKRGEIVDYIGFFLEKVKELNSFNGSSSLNRKLDIEKIHLCTSNGCN